MPNKLTITFNSIPAEGDYINFNISIEGNAYTKSEVFALERETTNRAKIGTTAVETAENFAQAFFDDYAKEFEVFQTGNQVTIFSLHGYTISDIVILGDFASTQTEIIGMAVGGLPSNRYLINNEIYMTFATGAPSPYYDVRFDNLYNFKTATARIYPNLQGVASMYVAATIKSIFEYPSDAPNYIFQDQIIPNANQVRITVSSPGFADFEITKLFVRGGKQTNDSNQTLSASQSLRPAVNLPVWQGYDTADYVFSGNSIVKKLLSEVSVSIKDIRRTKGCNEVYVKYANQQGGYCHWLFNSHEQTISGGSDGVFVRSNRIEDLGGESTSKIRLFGKIPEYYKGYVDDLVVSQEVYILRNNKWVRVSMANNSHVFDNIQRAYNVKLNVDFNYRFNPSLLWSN